MLFVLVILIHALTHILPYHQMLKRYRSAAMDGVSVREFTEQLSPVLREEIKVDHGDSQDSDKDKEKPPSKLSDAESTGASMQLVGKSDQGGSCNTTKPIGTSTLDPTIATDSRDSGGSVVDVMPLTQQDQFSCIRYMRKLLFGRKVWKGPFVLSLYVCMSVCSKSSIDLGLGLGTKKFTRTCKKYRTLLTP